MEKNTKVQKKIIAEEAMKAMQEIERETRMENVIKDNKIIFKVEEKEYRLRLPSVSEQEDIDKARRQKYIEIVQDDSYLFRKQWVDIYKKKGIDIHKMEESIRDKMEDIRKTFLRLAEAQTPKDITNYKDEITKLRDEVQELNIRKTDLMANSIEDQLIIFVNSYTVFTVLERKENDKWVRHFTDYEVYNKSEDWKLLNKAYYYMSYLIFGGDK